MNVRIVAVRVSFAVAAGAAVLSLRPTSLVANDPLDDRYVIRDAASAASLLLNLDQGSPAYGSFTYAAAGLGLVWPVNQATVTVLPTGQVSTSYAGVGRIDQAAHFDPIFAIHEGSGESEVVQITLVSVLNRQTSSGTATIVVGSEAFSLLDPGLIPGSQAVLQRVVAAATDEDWSDLWNEMSDYFRSDTSLAEFTAGIAAGLAPHGDVVEVVAGPLTPVDGQAGLDIVHAPLTVRLDDAGTITELEGTVALIWEIDRWAVLTITPE